ncbi:MAG: helix-turn-helix domain-containing protein [Clostridiales bacterium]|nr:helix-turn-helix domain-containing protein [Clostridiales bacterium]
MNDNVVDFVLQILKSNHIPTYRHLQDSEEIIMFDQGLRETIFHLENLEKMSDEFFERIEPQNIYYITDAFHCSYMVFSLPDTSETIICGPVIFEQFQGNVLSDLLKKLNIPEELHDQMRDYYLGITLISDQCLFLSIFITLGNYLYGKDNYKMIETDFGDMDKWFDYYENHFRIPDEPFLSIQMIEQRYSMEAMLISAIESGNESKAAEALSQISSVNMPSRLKNELRDNKDYCITVNTLARKSAETAGVHPIHIDALSNENIKKIEQLTSVEQCRMFQRDSVMRYCRLIRRHTLNNYSPLIQKVLTYITTDLSVDLSLTTLSEQLSVNASYLSTLFKKEMSVPLTNYVNHCRIQYAQLLLTQTTLPIKVIAQQCGIPGIYYFGRLFKKISGTTPKAYRNASESNRKYGIALPENPRETELTPPSLRPVSPSEADQVKQD